MLTWLPHVPTSHVPTPRAWAPICQLISSSPTTKILPILHQHRPSIVHSILVFIFCAGAEFYIAWHRKATSSSCRRHDVVAPVPAGAPCDGVDCFGPVSCFFWASARICCCCCFCSCSSRRGTPCCCCWCRPETFRSQPKRRGRCRYETSTLGCPIPCRYLSPLITVIDRDLETLSVIYELLLQGMFLI